MDSNQGKQHEAARPSPEKPKRLSDVPPELVISIIEFLLISDVENVQCTNRYYRAVVDKHWIGLVNGVIERERARLAEHTDSFNYQGMHFLAAFKHWNENKGFWLNNLKEHAYLFATWYGQCHGFHNERLKTQSDFRLYAGYLACLYFARHQHHFEGLSFDLEDFGPPDKHVTDIDNLEPMHYTAFAKVFGDGSVQTDHINVSHDHTSLFEFGTIYGSLQPLARRPNLPDHIIQGTYYYKSITLRQKHILLTRLVVDDHFTENPCIPVEEDQNLLNMLNLPALHLNMFAYCTKDHETLNKARQAVRNGGIRRLAQAQMLENMYIV